MSFLLPAVVVCVCVCVSVCVCRVLCLSTHQFVFINANIGPCGHMHGGVVLPVTVVGKACFITSFFVICDTAAQPFPLNPSVQPVSTISMDLCFSCHNT